jgi:parallel beta-helix repeat protein
MKLIAIIVFLLLGTGIISSFGYQIKEIKNSGRGNIFYVGGSGTGNFTNIQEAIDNASNGDTVFVFNGTYFGYININKSIDIIGEDKNTTFIIGYVAYTISILSDWVNISGFTIQNGERYGEGVRIDSNYNNFLNNIIDTPNDNIRISGIGNTISANSFSSDSIILSGDSNIITNNIITNDYHGIYLTDSSDNIILNNSFYNSGLFISEDSEFFNTVMNNTVNDKSLEYIFNESDLILNNDAGQIILVNCTNITVQDQVILNTTAGIQLWGSNSCIISGNTISENHYGLCIYGSKNIINDNNVTKNTYDGICFFGNNNTLSKNIISNNDNGIYLYYSDYNTIKNNNFTNNNYNIQLDYGSDFNKIINNIIKNSQYAISISSFNNTIFRNNFSENDKGIYLGGQSKDNTIYHNNFINNIQNAYDTGINIWNKDPPSGGNYWDDYTGSDNNSDGFGDIPYPIPGGSNQDNYPFIEANGWINKPPDKPSIYGPVNGRPRKEYKFETRTIDPDDDQVYYKWNWDDNSYSDWIGPYESGEETSASHSWRKGNYNITVKAKDIFGAESEWSYPFTIIIPRNHEIIFNIFQQIIQRFPLLKTIIGLQY